MNFYKKIEVYLSLTKNNIVDFKLEGLQSLKELYIARNKLKNIQISNSPHKQYNNKKISRCRVKIIHALLGPSGLLIKCRNNGILKSIAFVLDIR